MKSSIENAEYYAARKSEQDMGSALKACTTDFELISPPFGRTMKGVEENLDGMAQFFALFPDYNVEADCTLNSDTNVLMVGHVSLTPNFDLLQIPGQPKTARLAFSAAFETRENLLCRETFIVDLVDLCSQSNLPLDRALDLFGRRQQQPIAVSA